MCENKRRVFAQQITNCIYKAKKPSIRLSIMPITRLSQPTLTYQLSNIINPLSSYFNFVTVS